MDALQQRGWSVWWDRTIRPGKTWDQVIEEALAEARCVIVLWSRDSVQSDWVKAEADEAKQRGILVPALLDNVTIPLGFRRIQSPNLADWSGVSRYPEFDGFIRAIAEVLSNEVASASEAVPHKAETSKATTNAPPTPARVLMIGLGGALIVFIGLAQWYFADKSPASKPLPAHVREQPKVESPGSRPAPPADPGIVVVPQTDRKLPPPPNPALPGQVQINPKDGLTYVFIPPGKFVMGCSPHDSECDADNEPSSHAEQISNGFWLGQTEVTQTAWRKVNIGANPSHFKGDRLPVETVDWN